MKLSLIKFIPLCLSLFAINISAQVTIGSTVAPNQGSLLDLKQQESDSENVTAQRGLMLPRVELKNPNELMLGDFTINDTDDGGNQKQKHIGLVVFNVSETDPFCTGIYVWDGTEWIPLEKCASPITIDDRGPFYVASGQDLRTITGIPPSIDMGIWNFFEYRKYSK